MYGREMRAIGSYPACILGWRAVDPGQRLTLITLYALANDEMVVWASAQEIADANGYTLRATHQHLRHLAGYGQTRPVKRKDPRSNAHFKGIELRMNTNGDERWKSEGKTNPVV